MSRPLPALLDTNVLSELTRPKPEPAVVDYVAELEHAWLSTVTLHELRFGLLLLPEGKRRADLAAALDQLLARYSERILMVDPEVARSAAHHRWIANRFGRVLHLADALIAGTASVHGLALATRNVMDFEGLGLTIVNPWIAKPEP